MLKIGMCQINPTVGDVRGNVELMRDAAREAIAAGAQVLVFPELCLTGYYPGDLLEERAFLAEVEAGIELVKNDLSRGTPESWWVLGAPLPRSGPGKPLENALLVAKDGEIVHAYAKQLLPTYDVFDERRHFEPGPAGASVLEIEGVVVGFLICEDGWNEAGLDYAANPFAQLALANPEVIVSINASPSSVGKREQRHALFSAASQRHGVPILYVNQVGGQDQVVYDGASFAVEPRDGVVFEAASFRSDVPVLSFGPQGAHGSDRVRFCFQSVTRAPEIPAGDVAVTRALPQVGEPLPRMEFYRQQIVLGLRDYARRCGFQRVVVGSSGGIDSALTLALAAEALGPENVMAVTMPSPYSSAGSVDDSEVLCHNLGVQLYRFPISDPFHELVGGFACAFGEAMSGLTTENLQARIRGTILMAASNHFGSLLLTTGNKSELSVGYCTLYGDTNGGLGLLGDLYKTEVFELCRHLNLTAGREIIPVAIIDKPPSAELAPGQRDSDSLPPYEQLDDILKLLVEGDRLPKEEYAEVETRMRAWAWPSSGALVRKVQGMLWRSEYKRRQAPPIIRLRARAFGSGRQMPIAAVHGY